MNGTNRESASNYTSPHHKVRLIRKEMDGNVTLSDLLSEMKDMRLYFDNKLDKLKNEFMEDIDLKYQEWSVNNSEITVIVQFRNYSHCSWIT